MGLLIILLSFGGGWLELRAIAGGAAPSRGDSAGAGELDAGRGHETTGPPGSARRGSIPPRRLSLPPRAYRRRLSGARLSDVGDAPGTGMGAARSRSAVEVAV